MERAAALIIGDWGNSNARMWLCDAVGDVIDTRRGPGIATLRSDPGAIATAFVQMTAGWPPAIPALLAGVVGAIFGWCDAGYLPCPVAISEVGGAMVQAPYDDRPVWIAPGVRCTNPWGEPDTMRGEEVQIAGWAAQHHGPDARVALPGTHCKWAHVEAGQITAFHSAISGELFALLTGHSVMVDRHARGAPHDADAFAQGVELTRRTGGPDLSALLFAARARQATGAMTPEAAPSFLSGIVIGCDIRWVLRNDDGPALPLWLVGVPPLADLYAKALAMCDRRAEVADGDAMMRAGLMTIALRNGVIG